ncbi:MAG: tRNA pseudouridine(55) synthase TruB [Vicinamibacterales bacterium]|jgi:tRNA pseudouridine55 synthase|nr:tRNA pseudouridine(55) synthase TruB [Acidobacteriota bacterium]MDP6609128.1 tRNA pseudouridine(55) synthase TruB [Vicinamibacterales bacterium]|tara:strand:- start:2698 stop:3609 length:912 start_codon:yes stop_codon:yes gene_type:complete
MTTDGVLVVDKPSGPTSHDVVAWVRRALGTKRIGHTGTLDPLATGVLALVVGRATRLAQFLLSDSKVYTATIRLGVSTDTYDALGTPVEPARDASPTPARDGEAAVESVLKLFRGRFDQRPPPYSAKKIAGTRAYALARRGRPIAPAPVPVAVNQLELLELADDRLRLSLECSAGFYVRSLAQDIGEALGCGAHLEALRRTRTGAFDLAQAVPMDREGLPTALVDERLVPLSRLLPEWPTATLTSRGRRRAAHGQPIVHSDLADVGVADEPPAGRIRLLDDTGQLVALAEARDGALHPRVVLV